MANNLGNGMHTQHDSATIDNDGELGQVIITLVFSTTVTLECCRRHDLTAVAAIAMFILLC